MAQYIVDLSKYQISATDASWRDIAAKCCAVILRIGIRGYGASGVISPDNTFATHKANAEKHGLPVGVYFFTQAVSPAEGRAEADWVAAHFDIKASPLPIYCDSEWANAAHTGRADKLTKAQRTEAVRAFCERIRELGGKPGIYASTSWIKTQLDMSKLPYSIWQADYRSSAKLTAADCELWQYSSTNALNIAGFGGHLDCNVMLRDLLHSQPAAAPDAQQLAFVKAVQVACGVAGDGIVGPKTKAALPTIRAGLLGKNQRHKAVPALQQRLTALGYDCGKVDGVYGIKTAAAVSAYQYDKRLANDGICGPKTWLSLLGV